MKLTKNFIKKLIMEEIGGPVPRSGNSMHVYPGYGYQKQFPDGNPPDNSNDTVYQGRPPYETLGVEVDTKDGQILITIGKLKYKLIFDNEDLTSGRVVPIGEYKFTVERKDLDSNLTWQGDAPPHVRFDSHLEKQILDYAGREVKKD